MELVFYKGKGKIWSSLVRWWTGSKYSHCELVLSDGTWISADPKAGRVRYTWQDISNDWDRVEIKVTERQELIIRAWLDAQIGKKYDWCGILLSQVFTLGTDNPVRYFCSELCVEALQRIGKLSGVVSHRVDPGMLARMYGL